MGWRVADFFPSGAISCLWGPRCFVFYRFQADPAVAGLSPEQIFPHFIITRVPAGVAGFVIVGLIAAAMSTLDSSINAIAATLTNDFYRRLWRRDRDDHHYGRVGRGLTLGARCGDDRQRVADPRVADR
ncbi:MAG: hypothetical protein Ct9H300mP1_24020 [Planctomycetaceae bacterium]|nr:MAG: hypothetical protein Ct9H300mP1_24020 [Planctomycetaceae bacterium]